MGTPTIQHKPDERNDNNEAWKDLLVLIAAFALGFILGGMR
jgi:hypothetical protein